MVERFLRERSERAFVALYRRHTPALLQLARRLAGAAAEDAVQEAWLRAAAALPLFAWRSSLRTWLCGFVVNCAREALRRRAEAAPQPQPAPVPAPPDGDLERLLATLPAGAREVLVLHDLYGYTHEEIGDLLDIEAGTSKSQLSRARHALRERLATRSDDGG